MCPRRVYREFQALAYQAKLVGMAVLGGPKARTKKMANALAGSLRHTQRLRFFQDEWHAVAWLGDRLAD